MSNAYRMTVSNAYGKEWGCMRNVRKVVALGAAPWRTVSLFRNIHLCYIPSKDYLIHYIPSKGYLIHHLLSYYPYQIFLLWSMFISPFNLLLYLPFSIDSISPFTSLLLPIGVKGIWISHSNLGISAITATVISLKVIPSLFEFRSDTCCHHRPHTTFGVN